jgi:hypothetical protein
MKQSENPALAVRPCLARFCVQPTTARRIAQLEPAFGGPDDEPIEGKLDRTAGEALAGLDRHVIRINGALT